MTVAVPRRVVVDPNVFISAAISPGGVTARILDLMDAGTVVPVVSAALIHELNDVLVRPRFRRYFDLETAAAFVAELERLGEWHHDVADTARLSPDPDDDYLLALAVTSDADALVSGDKDLTALTIDGVRILTPRMLVDLIETGG